MSQIPCVVTSTVCPPGTYLPPGEESSENPCVPAAKGIVFLNELFRFALRIFLTIQQDIIALVGELSWIILILLMTCLPRLIILVCGILYIGASVISKYRWMENAW